MSEGSLEAPIRHPLAWQEKGFYDETALDEEMRRIFDICHGCRRCFNLCDTFPRLFDLIDESDSGELDTVDSVGFEPVVGACTLCDMCFMTKCPYVPPHEFNLDFPHLMLRYRAIQHRKGKVPWQSKQMSKTDRNGRLAKPLAPLVNWALDEKNGLTRKLMQSVAGIHKEAALPRFNSFTLEDEAAPEVASNAPAKDRKVVLYATCYGKFNNPKIGYAARGILARNGVETEVVHPSCCGMPLLEQGDLAAVAESARNVAAEFGPWIDKGYDIVALMPSCALMLKFEWPLILPDNPAIKKLSEATKDITEYIVDIAKNEGLAEGMTPLGGKIAVHLACHARAQNMGAKAAELMRLLPDSEVQVIERCSGHGGSWGVMQDNFDTALKVGRPVARQLIKDTPKFYVSECPLAGMHIGQGVERADGNVPETAPHPVVLFARAYGIAV